MSEKKITIRLKPKMTIAMLKTRPARPFLNVYRPGCMEHYVPHCWSG